jgi:hypothetical protein
MAIKSLLTVKGVLLTTATLAVVCGGIYANSQHSGKAPTMGPVATKSSQPTADQKSQIDYGPPTQDEKDQANAKTNAIQQINNDKNAQSSKGTKKSVTPIITSISKNPVTIYGQVGGVFEDGGVCTATFTQGSKVVTATGTGFENASTTNCPPISTDKLGGGTWNVSLGYSSASAEGTSLTKSFQP